MRILPSRGSGRQRQIGLALTPSRARRVAGCGLLAGVLLAGCGPGATAAGGVPGLVVRSGARYEYYDVEGATLRELSQSMRSSRPAAQRGLGLTSWNVTWRASWSGSPCRVRQADVSTTIVVSMPHWKVPPDAPPGLVEDWNRMMRALSVHEAGHVEHAVVAEREVRRALMGVTAPSCYTMDLLTRQVAQRVLEENRLRNRRYDERTDGGRTQGVVWPPRARTDSTAIAHEDEPAEP